jgi:hypothetical protein
MPRKWVVQDNKKEVDNFIGMLVRTSYNIKNILGLGTSLLPTQVVTTKP